MEEKNFGSLPDEIREQIKALLNETGKGFDDESAERYARIWKTKYDLFTGQIANVGMEIIDTIDKNDARGMILLTYSGSLVALWPATDGKRKLEYASIKFRTDVPDFVKGDEVSLASGIARDSVAEFDGSPLKKSSAIYRVACCPEGTSERDQEERIREAMIFLTNGFMKINRTVNGPESTDTEQFTTKAIVASIARRNGITQTLARAVVDDFLSTVEAGVLLGERVSVGKLGSLSLRYQDARKARVMKNIATGEDLLVPAKPACLVPKFAVSGALKEKSASIDPERLGLGPSSGNEDEEE